MEEYKNGDNVGYSIGGWEGMGEVVGISTTNQLLIGKGYILRDTTGNFPNEKYPYSYFVCFQCNLKKVE